jgi:hypothetical protein
MLSSVIQLPLCPDTLDLVCVCVAPFEVDSKWLRMPSMPRMPMSRFVRVVRLKSRCERTCSRAQGGFMFDKYSRTTTIGSDPFNDLHPPARSVHCLTVVGLLVTNAAIERSQPTTLDTRRGYVYVLTLNFTG